MGMYRESNNVKKNQSVVKIIRDTEFKNGDND